MPDIERDYFISNAARMRYPAFRAEADAGGQWHRRSRFKTVVSTRAKRAGMRWTPEGPDPVLAVRTTTMRAVHSTLVW